MQTESIQSQAIAIAEVYGQDGRQVVQFLGLEDEAKTADLAREVTGRFGDDGPGAWEGRVWDPECGRPINVVLVAPSESDACNAAHAVERKGRKQIKAFDQEYAGRDMVNCCDARCGYCRNCFG